MPLNDAVLLLVVALWHVFLLPTPLLALARMLFALRRHIAVGSSAVWLPSLFFFTVVARHWHQRLGSKHDCYCCHRRQCCSTAISSI